VFFWFKGHVVFAISGRVVILVGINPENAEVAGMSRPHPVIGVATKFTDI
jgi:hypothetical protein